MENEDIAKRDFNNFLKKKMIIKGATEIEVEGHLNKARRNLLFAKEVIDELKGYYEWSLVIYYYAVYQAALALCALKGFKTKKHLATICLLVNFFYPKHISKEDLTVISETTIKDEDINNFVELKGKREDANYSISVDYEREVADEMGKKAIEFVNKAERIIEENSKN